MIFSSITFLFYFLPISLLVYYMSPLKARNFILLLFSLLFYAWGEPKYIFLMLFSSVLDYILARVIDKYRGKMQSKIALCCSVIVNLSLLFFFKYTNFFIGASNDVFKTSFDILNLTLPIGISFYTFQTMSYSIDVYRGDAPVQRNLISLATYVSLFPQLVAGPIVRYQTVAQQIDKREYSFSKFEEGVYRFCLGMSKKVILANNIGILWNHIKMLNYSEISLLTAWLGIFSFGLQIYFDFSGYSDMAIGLGKMFGFDFLENFNYPYISKSITEFWRRWHMSLGQWFRDYVYIPLGGNRKGKARWFLNIFIVWCLTGFWHGADYNFIIWGLYFGVVLVIEKVYLLDKLNKLPNFIRHIYVLLLVSISWVLFEISSLSDICEYIKAMCFNFNIVDQVFFYLFIPNIVLILFAVLSATPIFKNLIKRRDVRYILVLIGLILSIAFLLDESFNPFLYFRF